MLCARAQNYLKTMESPVSDRQLNVPTGASSCDMHCVSLSLFRLKMQLLSLCQCWYTQGACSCVSVLWLCIAASATRAHGLWLFFVCGSVFVFVFASGVHHVYDCVRRPWHWAPWQSSQRVPIHAHLVSKLASSATRGASMLATDAVLFAPHHARAPIAELSFLAYLLHPMVMQKAYATVLAPIQATQTAFAMHAAFNVAVTLVLAAVLHICIDKPAQALVSRKTGAQGEESTLRRVVTWLICGIYMTVFALSVVVHAILLYNIALWEPDASSYNGQGPDAVIT